VPYRATIAEIAPLLVQLAAKTVTEVEKTAPKEQQKTAIEMRIAGQAAEHVRLTRLLAAVERFETSPECPSSKKKGA
jgi:hypothetical protein